MKDETILAEFYGTLGRVQVEDDVATLRFYPFTLNTDRALPVLSLTVKHPDFTANDLHFFAGGEISLTVHPQSAEMEECDHDVSKTLRGTRLSFAHVAYDAEDYTLHIEQLVEHNRDLQVRLHKAETTLARSSVVVVELLRRAEIKAAASKEHRLRQQPAIEVLKRMLTELRP